MQTLPQQTSDPNAPHDPRAAPSGLSVLLTLLSGCASLDRRPGAAAATGASADALATCSAAPGSKRWARTELYFGLSKPDGSLISEADFQRFLDAGSHPALSRAASA